MQDSLTIKQAPLQGCLFLYKSVIHNNSIEKYLLHSEIEKAVYLMALIEYIEHKYKMEMSETTKQYKKYALDK